MIFNFTMLSFQEQLRCGTMTIPKRIQLDDDDPRDQWSSCREVNSYKGQVNTCGDSEVGTNDDRPATNRESAYDDRLGDRAATLGWL